MSIIWLNVGKRLSIIQFYRCVSVQIESCHDANFVLIVGKYEWRYYNIW